MIVGQDLADLRRHLQMTTSEVADHVGVTQMTYENWEKDVGQPKMAQFLKLCAFYSVDISSLFKHLAKLNDQKEDNSNDINNEP